MFRIFILFLLLGGGILILGFLFRGPSVPERAVLVVDLRQALPERTEDGLSTFLGGPEMDLLSLRQVLLAASGDPRVKGILLRVGSAGLDLALAEELKSKVEDFRHSGKFVVSFLEGADVPGYLVSAASDEVVLDPSFNLDLVGISLRALFLGEALRQFGLEFDLVRVGEYKGSFEQLTRGQPTTAFRQALAETADSLYTNLVEGIAASRNLTPAQVRAAIDEGPHLPARAVELKLVDRIGYRDQLEEILSQKAGGTPVEPMEAVEYLNAVGEPTGNVRIAVVHVNGMLADFDVPVGLLPWTITTAEEVAASLREIREDSSIQGVLLRIDSPGGTISAAERIHREVTVTRRLKPVIATMGGTAASGGYYIACAADRVVAHPSTITGSIGIFGGKVVLAKILAEYGVRIAEEARGRRAGMFTLTRPFTEEEKASLEGMIREGYRQFVDRVAVGRKKPMGDVERLAQGRIWTGSQAVKNGLADESGGIEEAVAAVKNLARMDSGEQVSLVPFPERLSLLDVLRGGRRKEPAIRAEKLDPEALKQFFNTMGLDGRRALALSPVRLFIR